MSHQSENYSLNGLLTKLGLVEHECVILRNEEQKGYDIFSTEIRKKIETINPDAIYVFHKQPLILFFDLIGTNNQVRESEIHEQVWSFNQAPVAFIIKDGEVQALNAFAYVKKYGKKGLAQIKLSIEALAEKFSFWNLQSGETWKWLQKEYYEKHRQKKTQKRVNQQLFENIKSVREALKSEMAEDDANTLILRLIFIRYLIDRKVKIDQKFIKGKIEDVTTVVSRILYGIKIIRKI